MKKNLADLICDYQDKVYEALVLMQRSGIRMPGSRFLWITSKTPQKGKLDGGMSYIKHGAGCTFYFPDGEVDFDFGDGGEINGFDVWRLSLFLREKLSKYGFESLSDFEACFESAVADGHLVRSEDSLFYVANLKRVLAVDLDSRLPGDNLPARNLDMVLVLDSHYFQVAELMLENHEKLLQQWKKKNSLSHRRIIDLRIYMSSWLGFLAVTCEGFNKLDMYLLLNNDRPAEFKNLINKNNKIVKLIKLHRNSLREFRNKTFHLRENPEVIRSFFDPDAERLEWARELHQAFKDFFYAYRFQCELHYGLNGRWGDVRIAGEPSKRYSW